MRRKLTDRPATIPRSRSRAALARSGCARLPFNRSVDACKPDLFSGRCAAGIAVVTAFDGHAFTNLRKSRSPQHQQEDQTKGS